jgi:hypothetical protein
MIRRELPQTIVASQVEPVANVLRGFSFALASAAADLIFEMDNTVHLPESFLLFLYLESFCFLAFGSRYAAICCVQVASALIPIAQMKPNSSPPITVMAFLCSLPAMSIFM